MAILIIYSKILSWLLELVPYRRICRGKGMDQTPPLLGLGPMPLHRALYGARMTYK